MNAAGSDAMTGNDAMKQSAAKILEKTVQNTFVQLPMQEMVISFLKQCQILDLLE